MKKFLALLLAVLMLASMSVTAFATEVTDKVEGEKTGTVEVQIVDEDGNVVESTDTYSVQIKWTGLTFALQVTDADKDIQWDGSNYTITNGSWVAGDHNVTITNNSDVAVKVDANFTTGTKAADAKYGITARLNGSAATLASAVNITAQSATYDITLDSVPNTLPELKFDVAVINVTIQKTA